MLILLPNLNVSKRLCMDNAHRRSVLAFTLSVIMGALSMLESIYCHYKTWCFDLALVCKVQLFGVSDEQIFNTWLVSVLRQHNKKKHCKISKGHPSKYHWLSSVSSFSYQNIVVYNLFILVLIKIWLLTCL